MSAQIRKLARRVVEGGDCSKGYLDRKRNPAGSWAWDMIRMAEARRRFGGNKIDVLVPGTGRTSKTPLER